MCVFRGTLGLSMFISQFEGVIIFNCDKDDCNPSWSFCVISISAYDRRTGITPDQLFSAKEIAANLNNIIKFIKKTKCFERKPKLTKENLSPRKTNKKRKNTTKNTNPKRIKINTMGKYYNKNNPRDMN